MHGTIRPTGTHGVAGTIRLTAAIGLLVGLSILAFVPPVDRSPSLQADDPPRSASTTTQSPVPEAALRSEVLRAIGDLDADAAQARRAALARLVELGPAILPHLPPPDVIRSEAARGTVRDLRIALELRLARDSVRPTRLDLTATLPLGEALQRIARQTRNVLDLGSVPEETLRRDVTLDLDDVTYWQTVDLLAALGGLRLGPPARDGVPALVPDPPGAPPADVAVDDDGAFRVSARQAVLRPRVGDSPFRLLRVEFALTAEPRLRPLFLKTAGRNLTVQVVDGPALEPFSPDAKLDLPFGDGGRGLRLAVDLRVPQDVPVAAVALRGRWDLTVAADAEPIAFESVAGSAGVSRRRGGVVVRVEEAAFGEPVDGLRAGRVRVKVAYDTGGPQFESHRSWMFHNAAYLEDAQGRRTDRQPAFKTLLQADGGVVVEYEFAQVAGDPQSLRFVYVAPTLIVETPVEFGFVRVPVADPTTVP